MKKFVFGIALLGGLFGGSASNPEQGLANYEEGKYMEAGTFYLNALEEYPDQRPHLHFNLGQCNLRMDSTVTALGFFSQATNIGRLDPKLASLSWNQIGGIHASTPPTGPQPGAAQAQGSTPGEEQANPLEIALEDFKNALRLDSDNELARYNYELLKRKLQQQQQQQQQDENEDKQDEQQDQENKNQQDQDKQDKQDQNKQDKQEQQKPDNEENKGNQGKNQQEGEPSEEKMSMEQAKMLLEAMNQNEKMFLQQLQKSKQKKGPRNRGPEW